MLPLDLFFIRHNESEGNRALRKYEEWLKRNWFLRLFCGLPLTVRFLNRHHTDFPLTDTGKEQGPVVGVWLNNWLRENKLPCFDRHLVSSHLRTVQSAGLLGLPNAQWELDFQLHERVTGLWGVIPDKKWQAQHEKSIRLGRNHHFYTSWPGGESIADVCGRLRNFINTLHRECGRQRVVVVAHGDVMQAFRVIFEGILPDEYDERSKANLRDFRIGNGQIIHYTRVDPIALSGLRCTNYDRFGWVRSFNPWCPEYAGHDWRPIEKRRYSNAELLALAERFPQLIKK